MEIKDILTATESEIKNLINLKKTGKFELTLELNMNQGGLGKTYIRQHTREEILTAGEKKHLVNRA